MNKFCDCAIFSYCWSIIKQKQISLFKKKDSIEQLSSFEDLNIQYRLELVQLRFIIYGSNFSFQPMDIHLWFAEKSKLKQQRRRFAATKCKMQSMSFDVYHKFTSPSKKSGPLIYCWRTRVSLPEHKLEIFSLCRIINRILLIDKLFISFRNK